MPFPEDPYTSMKKVLCLAALTAALFSSCDKNDETPTGRATLSFDAVVGTEDFALNKDFTISGKTWNFTQFRYWVSNVVLIKTNGEEYVVPDSFYLIEENNAAGTNSTFIYPANKRENVDISEIPEGDYRSVRFSIGVSEKYNNNLSLQAGELSQLNGMTNVSWMWATSYIFSSLKGKVTATGASQTIAVETGLNTNYKSVSLDFSSSVHIGSSKSPVIVLNADVTKVTDGLDIIATPAVGASEADAMSKVAGNYATKVFSVRSVNQ